MTTRLFRIIMFVFCFSAGGATDHAPCIRHLESINYNPVARGARLQGDVPLALTIDAEGKVEKVVVIQTAANPLLQKEATKNIKGWTFEPGGKREFTITYEFRLEEPEIDGPSPSTMAVDFPSRVRVTSNFRTISRD